MARAVFDRIHRVNPFSFSSVTWKELEEMDPEEAAKLTRKLIWKEMIPRVMILLLVTLILLMNLNRIIAWIVGILVSKGVIW